MFFNYTINIQLLSSSKHLAFSNLSLKSSSNRITNCKQFFHRIFHEMWKNWWNTISFLKFHHKLSRPPIFSYSVFFLLQGIGPPNAVRILFRLNTLNREKKHRTGTLRPSKLDIFEMNMFKVRKNETRNYVVYVLQRVFTVHKCQIQ